MTVSIPISASSPGFQLHTELWKAAYERLDEDLRRRYEVLLKAELNADMDSNLDDQAVLLLERRKQRVENRQWTYRWRGRPRKVRDQVDTILDVVQKGSSIISVGMNFAPIFVSMPWTAITTLLPVSLSFATLTFPAFLVCDDLRFPRGAYRNDCGTYIVEYKILTANPAVHHQ